jgi:hypothetical protein
MMRRRRMRRMRKTAIAESDEDEPAVIREPDE